MVVRALVAPSCVERISHYTSGATRSVSSNVMQNDTSSLSLSKCIVKDLLCSVQGVGWGYAGMS